MRGLEYNNVLRGLFSFGGIMNIDFLNEVFTNDELLLLNSGVISLQANETLCSYTLQLDDCSFGIDNLSIPDECIDKLLDIILTQFHARLTIEKNDIRIYDKITKYEIVGFTVHEVVVKFLNEFWNKRINIENIDRTFYIPLSVKEQIKDLLSEGI